MRSIAKCFLLVAMAALMTVPMFAAEDGKKGKGKGKGRRPQAGAQLMKQLEKAELSDEQKGKVKEVIAKYAKEIAEAQKGVGDARKAIGEARKKALDDGKKGKELAAAINAVELTADQRAALTKSRELNVKMRQEIGKLLTPEQREKAGFRGRKRGKKTADK